MSTCQSPGGVTVLYGPESDPWLADGAGKRFDDSGHEALHLQEVSSANTGGPVHQEDDICCSHIITPACRLKWWREEVNTTNHMSRHTNTGGFKGVVRKIDLYLFILFLPCASACFMKDSHTVTVKTRLHIFITWAQEGQINLLMNTLTSISSH